MWVDPLAPAVPITYRSKPDPPVSVVRPALEINVSLPAPPMSTSEFVPALAVSVSLADVRMHDLRHSFASLLINSGRTLYEVQHILGHTQVKTTQRYAHLSQDTLPDAANAATRAVGAVMLPVVSPALTHISV